MCGICGAILLESDAAIDRVKLRRMTESLGRRGPDANGLFVKDNVAFGHTRLKIIDLVSGSQPQFNEDETILIVFNGEIYNFCELRRHLQGKGHQFSTASDTEVILHLYEEKGEQCVADLRGMFAFAIYDINKRTFFAARDRLGKKPFYYYWDGKTFIFGSEMKAILAYLPEHEWDLCAVKDYFSHQFIQAPRTIYKSISKLPAAHMLTLQGGELTRKRYWRVPFPTAIAGSFAESCDQCLAILHEAVKRRLVSDVPLGAFLSGGIDSTIITALMKKDFPGEVKTFSIGFLEKTFDERAFARLAAKALQTNHKEYVVTWDIKDFAQTVLPYFDEPFGDSSAIATHYLCRETKKDVTVALSGDGGDELFGGYNRYIAGKVAKYYCMVPKWLRSNLLENFIKFFPQGSEYYGESILKKLTLFIDFANRSEADPLFVLTTPFSPNDLDRLFSVDLQHWLKQNACRDHGRHDAEEYSRLDRVTQMMYTDINTYLPEDVLVKVDMMSMYHGLEVRAPFLDQDVVEFVSTMPLAYKLKGFRQKHILKEAFKNVIPTQIINRNKHGFALPVSDWFRGGLGCFTQKMLDLSGMKTCAGMPLFEKQYIHTLLEEHQSGRADNGAKLWMIFSFMGIMAGFGEISS